MRTLPGPLSRAHSRRPWRSGTTGRIHRSITTAIANATTGGSERVRVARRLRLAADNPPIDEAHRQWVRATTRC